MGIRIVTSKQIREVQIPEEKNGYNKDTVNKVIEVASDTVEELERQLKELQEALASARADSAPMDIGSGSSNPADEQVIARWLTTLSPLDISTETQRIIAESVVESTMAASHIRKEAKDRLTQLCNAVSTQVMTLIQELNTSQVSAVGVSKIPSIVTTWQKEFSRSISQLLQQLELPWTVQVSQLSQVLSKMAEGQVQQKTSPIPPATNNNINDNNNFAEQPPWQS